MRLLYPSRETIEKKAKLVLTYHLVSKHAALKERGAISQYQDGRMIIRQIRGTGPSSNPPAGLEIMYFKLKGGISKEELRVYFSGEDSLSGNSYSKGEWVDYLETLVEECQIHAKLGLSLK